MKILVIQLARLGDIYQTWPVLKALKRQNPGAEVHLLTRKKFASAAPTDPSSIDSHWLLDTRDVLAPLVDEKPGIDSSLAKLDSFFADLRAQGFDRIFNLSFSPFSSYLTAEIAGEDDGRCDVRGYSRFSDGYLSIPDDGSAYFFAQVGVGRANRLHVTDLFAHVAGVELTESDWHFSDRRETDACDETVLIHVGASDLGKTLSWSKWLQVAKGLLGSEWKGSVVLIGSSEERELSAKIAVVSGDRRIVNLAGETSLGELFEIVSEARLLIGGDSGPVQIASLTGTPTLNISLKNVSFWETGPRAKGSRILPVENEESVSAEEIVAEALAMLSNSPSRLPIIRVPGPTIPYVETRPQPMAFEWELLRAIYMGEPFPAPPHEIFLLGMKRLYDVNMLALEQIRTLRQNPKNKVAADILNRVDELLSQIALMVPEADIMIRWFRTERARIGPLSIHEVIEATSSAHARFKDVIGLYISQTEGDEGDDVVLGQP